MVIPCNTAHHFVERLRKEVKAPVLSIIDLTVAEAKRNRIGLVGLLASESTYEHNIYRRPLEKAGIKVVDPRPDEIRELTGIVLDIMGGRRTEADRKTIRRIVSRMMNEDSVRAVIVGCTELSLVLPADKYPIKAFDALDILAEAAVKEAYG